MKAIYMSREQPQRPREVLAQRPITEVMSSPVLCIPADTLLGDALQRMVHSGRRHLVVVDSAGRCLGVLADRALAASWAHDPGSFARDPVTVALTSHPAAIGTSGRVVDAARMMRGVRDDAVAVVDADRRPVGIVTGSDLIMLLSG
jgi:CBS domain-containing protein